MTGYYEQWEKDFARAYRFRLPIIMEGGWITGAHHRYWIDPSGKYRQGIRKMCAGASTKKAVMPMSI